MAYDLVIRGGQLVDGTGKEAVAGDIGIENGLITAIGKVDGRGHREIDAQGQTVTPGFVDITPTSTPRSAGIPIALRSAGTGSPRRCWAIAASPSRPANRPIASCWPG